MSARLIDAAPELLNELRELVEWVEEHFRRGRHELECSIEDLTGTARAAIAKATGTPQSPETVDFKPGIPTQPLNPQR